MNLIRKGFARLLCFSFIVGIALPARAQNAETDSTGWKKNMTAILAGSQASYNNWAEGGTNSLAFTASVKGNARRITSNWVQSHEVRLALGSLKQDSLDFRKADDLIQYKGAFEYKNEDAFANWHPTAALSFRSQFAEGFDYSTNPEAKVSAFFSPAILTQTLGFTNQPVEWFTWVIGVAAKETVVGIERFRPTFGNEMDEAVRFEPGFDTTAKIDRDLFENVNLQSTLNLFGAFGQINEPDVRWENLITMQVNSWLTVNFEYVTFYDKDIVDKLQTKQVLSTGISFKLL
jgi:hypothetical protein